MRAVVAAVAAALVLGLAINDPGRAAVDAAIGTRTSMELLVFEHPDCNYCQVFRNRVAPRYRQSPQEAEAPLRFVDVTGTDTDRLALKSPITMVPTAVLMSPVGRDCAPMAVPYAPVAWAPLPNAELQMVVALARAPTAVA